MVMVCVIILVCGVGSVGMVVGMWVGRCDVLVIWIFFGRLIRIGLGCFLWVIWNVLWMICGRFLIWCIS